MGCGLQRALLACGIVACQVPETTYRGIDSGGTPASLSATPNGPLALGTIIVGKTGAPASVTVSNDGDGDSGPISIQFDDATIGFMIVPGMDTCSGQVLAGHHTCKLALVFAPSTAAAVNTNVHVTATPGGDVVTALLGTGLIQGAVDITVDGYTFPDYSLGTAIEKQMFTIRNKGQTAIGTPVPSTTGGDPSFMVDSSDCASYVTFGTTDQCTVTVAWKPTAVGSISGSLVVTASNGGGGDSATLSGRATARVTVMPTGAGAGSVVSNTQPGIMCGATCAYEFDTSPVTLTPTASTGSSFNSWGTDCTGNAGCTLTLDAAKTVQARFELNAYPVSITLSQIDSGLDSVISSPAGLTCDATTRTCSGMFLYGTVVTLTAKADAAKSRFLQWAAGGSECPSSATDPTNPSCTFAMPATPTSEIAMFDWFAYLSFVPNTGDLDSSATVMNNAAGMLVTCQNTTSLLGMCTNIPITTAQVTIRYGTANTGNVSGQTVQDTWSFCQTNLAGSIDVENAPASSNNDCIVQLGGIAGCYITANQPGKTYLAANPIYCLPP